MIILKNASCCSAQPRREECLSPLSVSSSPLLSRNRCRPVRFCTDNLRFREPFLRTSADYSLFDMSAYGASESTWLYANAGATAVITVPIAILGLITCFKGRKRADPARTGFIWLKAAFALYFLLVVTLSYCKLLLNHLFLTTGAEASSSPSSKVPHRPFITMSFTATTSEQ